MKNYSKIIVLLSILLLGGLVFWQLHHLKISQDLKQELDFQDMQSILMESAIELRKVENKDYTIKKDSDKKRKLTDLVLKQNFEKFSQNIAWGFFNGNGKPIDSLNYDIDLELLKLSELKVCTSCLIMIDVLDESGESAIDKSYVLDQSPSQMRNIVGLDTAKMKYLYLYIKPANFNIKPYILPSIFLVGLTALFLWILYLNTKQYKLIKQKNEFVNHLSHQFQTPLSSIKLSANMLANKESDNKNELVKIIQTESNRLENHIKTVLHWVKSDADRLHINKNKESVTDLIEKSIKQMKPVFFSNNTKVNFIPPEEDFLIQVDANHLQLMLFNLWENAIKHNNTAIELNIKCIKTSNFISIITIDDGKGMQNTTEIKFKGLGLAYVDRIMELHHGNMKLIIANEKGLQVNLNFPKYD